MLGKRQASLTDMFAVRSAPRPRLETPRQPVRPVSRPTAPVLSNAPGSSSTLVPFEKEKWVSSVAKKLGKTDTEAEDLLALELMSMDDTWLRALHGEMEKDYFVKLKEFLFQEAKSKVKVFPPPQDIYTWSRLTPLDKVRVVIVGQDPYHGDGQAHGLAFSVRKGVPVPPSLRNMYMELEKEDASFKRPSHGFLEGWATQGVLMLNTCLTVRAHNAASHANRGWEPFTQSVIEAIDAAHPEGVVFLAWGAHAKKRVAGLDPKKHLILTSVHPSPLSAHNGFFGCGHFAKANEWLKDKYGETIDWKKL